MKRREFVRYASLSTLALMAPAAFGQLTVFGLRVVRESGWEQMMGRNLCIASKIYTTNPAGLICYGLELPDRSNLNDISAIPEGTYNASAKSSEKNGPVIELKDVPRRTGVQFHSGNHVGNTEGCIIFGNEPVTSAMLPTADQPPYIKRTKGCWISASRKARNKVLDEYGWKDRKQQPPNRFIQVTIESE